MKSIQSIQRALQILNLFSLNEPSFGISEMSRLLNLSKGTVQGIVRTLLQEGLLLQEEETRKYRLGVKLYELGITSAGSLEVNQRASRPAHELSVRTGMHVRVAIQHDDSAIVTLDAYPRSEPFLFRTIGPRTPLYCTALGKAILAFMDTDELNAYLERTQLVTYTSNTITDKDKLLKELEETRRRGYSINHEEHIFGRAAVGAPILGRLGKLVASLCIVDNPSKILSKQIGDLAKAAEQTAVEILMNMGYCPGHVTN
jgi:IclR family KDG regulon transcriptional repressor